MGKLKRLSNKMIIGFVLITLSCNRTHIVSDLYLKNTELFDGKYICKYLDDENCLILIHDVIEYYHDDSILIVKTVDSIYYKLYINQVNYKEDMLIIDIEDYSELKRQLDGW